MKCNINIRTAVIFWFLTIGYMCVIFYLSSRALLLPELPTNLDKLIHMAIYVPLAFLSYLSLNRSGLSRYLVISAFLIAGIYGITDEIHQSFVPGRDASMGDAVADFMGALLGSYGAGHLTEKVLQPRIFTNMHD
jgi:VanZ family protein